ncbi:MOZ protein represents a chromatin-associated acetyltransferase [Hirsutella rhossiliensis]|uniref:MOZ protein represents a chromatin-associated acetyltransferase n=1 Tax=Hirsutella rhossiliensis TaxID=111463 RepID=A0A9P8N2X0_9HYPO|nr:MOZ protein represents a chromatin-associated acetyltransferase [Hirsutella rhossiliensis]KAH0965895.1 MOZ protein represents a chromatin-associated acetyltransferase [Hirsutella rhossiliensis]
MPTGRPAFPYAQLVRAARSRAGIAAGGAATKRARGSFAPRHGKAVEPEVWEPQRQQQKGEQQQRHTRQSKSMQPSLPSADAQPVPAKGTVASATTKSVSTTKDSRPLEAVLLMDPPERVSQQHPHMAPPPYVHHFDSYSLVKQLQEGGYTQEQATTAMKGIRTLLAQNLDVAQQSLVSKSDVENETYLFTAACSELSTELKNNRRLQDEQMRQQRTLLQHEVDILTQSLNQELLTLNDNVRGMFNDRKMAVREEHKAVESAIQKITYKMSILLSSDSKSEIEGVRWILIRRSVLGIIFMAMLTLGMLRYATYVGQQRKLEAERRMREQEELRKDGGKTDHSSAADAAAILAAT